jgi:hypothetical protein
MSALGWRVVVPELGACVVKLESVGARWRMSALVGVL